MISRAFLPQDCLAATPLVDSTHPQVQAFAARHARGADDVERGVALYYAVRDGFRYDPYRIDLSPAGMSASSVLVTLTKVDSKWLISAFDPV